MISRFRPACPILAMTPSARPPVSSRWPGASSPCSLDTHGTADEIVWHAVEHAAHLGLITEGDVVAVLVGAPHDSEPTTDVLRLVRVR